jgi:XRE family transcriptional regulator, regulator of sulfur utilization
VDDDLLLRAFGQAIRILRDRRRWRQEDVAERSGVKRSYIGKIERGDTDPGARMQSRLARTLGASMAELWDLVERELAAMELDDEEPTRHP